MPTVPLARWRPDVAALNSQFASDVENVLCAATDYIPFPKLEPFSSAVPSQPTGAFSARNAAGQIVIFVGTADKIYQLNGTTLGWDNVSRLGTDSILTGTFAADTNWTKDTGWTISGGAAHALAVAHGDGLSQTQTIAAGSTYKVVFTVSGYVAGGLTPTFTGGTPVSGTTVTANGTYTQYLVGVTGNTALEFTTTDPAVTGENDSFTKIMLHMDGADASTTFTDVNLGGSAHTWTAAGNAQVDTAQSKFGGASALFDGTGDWITTPDHADFALGTGDFTIECWFNCNAAGGTVVRLAGQNNNTESVASTSFQIRRSVGNLIQAYVAVGAATFNVLGTTQFTNAVNTGWHHVAVVRTGGFLFLYIDGVQEGSATAISGSINDSANALRVGAGGEVTAETWVGWIDEFRLSVGIARYTANFTPATTAFRGNYTTLDLDTVTNQALANYASTVDERWVFEQFGNYVVAVNINDNPQVFQIGVSTNFADLAGSPPRARYVKAWGDFLALMNLSGNENRVHWSALNDITGWTPGTNNSDYQDFPDGGVVQGSSSATNPFVILKRAIYAGTFVPGSIEIFTFAKIHHNRGAAAPYAIASRGSFTIFPDSGGLFQLNSDGSILPIGFEKIDRTVFSRISGPDLASLFAEIDPFFNRYYLAVRYTAPEDSFDKIIIYDWGIGEFTQIDMEQDVLFPLASGTLGYTLEGLDAISASLDALPFSLDSKVWQGGAPVMGALDADHRLGFYSGPNAEAIVTTQEAGADNGTVTRLHEIVPVVDTQSALVSIGARMRRSIDDPVIWAPYRAQSTNTGIVRGRSRARYHTFKLKIPEDVVWTHAQAVTLNSQPAGSR
jgi:hypothetical protein